MQGRRHRLTLLGKARAMACGSNPRVLPMALARLLLFLASRLPVPAGPGSIGFLSVGCWNHGYHESGRVLWWVCRGDIDGWGDGLQDLWWFYAGFLRALSILTL